VQNSLNDRFAGTGCDLALPALCGYGQNDGPRAPQAIVAEDLSNSACKNVKLWPNA
jgi:hypothetical protein